MLRVNYRSQYMQYICYRAASDDSSDTIDKKLSSRDARLKKKGKKRRVVKFSDSSNEVGVFMNTVHDLHLLVDTL